MRLKSTGKALVLALTVTSALALSGCATAGSGNVSDHAESTHGEAAAGFSSDDIMFAQMMIPHHQQAVDLGTLAETRAQNPDVIALAAQIKAEQAPEIEQMKSWLAEAGAPLEMGHSSHMNGMLTEEQMSELESLSGTAFDRLFLKYMIEHHQGAVEMAESAISSKNAKAHELGHDIHDSQTDQIAYMQDLLTKL
jgi:uncharacterized protein (DUF305 family)